MFTNMIIYHNEACRQQLTVTQLVVFDLDGTLVDTFDDIAAATNQVLIALGQNSLPKAAIVPKVGQGAANLIKRCLYEDLDQHRLNQCVELWRTYYAAHPTDYAQLYPGCLQTLTALRQAGIKTAVVSNKLDDITQKIMENLKVKPWVELVLGETLELPRKPDPRILHHVMERLGSTPGHTVMVGDGAPDMEAAHHAGATSVGITTGLLTRTELAERDAHVTIDRLDELPQLLGLAPANGGTPEGCG